MYDTLFKDIWHAIRFAYAVEGGQLLTGPQSQLAKLLNPGGASHGSLSPEEWRAEAGLILADVAALPEMLRDYIRASYAWGSVRVVAIANMRRYAAQRWGDATPSASLLADLATRHFAAGLGGRPSQARIARDNGCHVNTVANWEKKLAAVYTPLEHGVEQAFTAKWRDGRIPLPQDEAPQPLAA